MCFGILSKSLVISRCPLRHQYSGPYLSPCHLGTEVKEEVPFSDDECAGGEEEFEEEELEDDAIVDPEIPKDPCHLSHPYLVVWR